MSRIHAALKRAERERAERLQNTRQAATGSVSGRLEHTTGVTVAFENSHSERAQATVPSSTAVSSYFEEVQEQCSKRSWKLDPKWTALSSTNHQAAGAEQFRALRSRLYRFRDAHTLRTVLVTSAMPAEGKTYVASNLAQSLVRQDGRRVLLIDADLRCPQLHVPLGATTDPGLGDYLQGKAAQMSVIQQGVKESLYFIPAGAKAPNPAELLGSDGMRSLLTRMTSAFDWIIIDSPPVLPVSDAGILAELCDGVLLVVCADKTPCAAAQKACAEFRVRNLVGIVVNRAAEGSAYAANSYYT